MRCAYDTSKLYSVLNPSRNMDNKKALYDKGLFLFDMNQLITTSLVTVAVLSWLF